MQKQLWSLDRRVKSNYASMPVIAKSIEKEEPIRRDSTLGDRNVEVHLNCFVLINIIPNINYAITTHCYTIVLPSYVTND